MDKVPWDKLIDAGVIGLTVNCHTGIGRMDKFSLERMARSKAQGAIFSRARRANH